MGTLQRRREDEAAAAAGEPPSLAATQAAPPVGPPLAAPPAVRRRRRRLQWGWLASLAADWRENPGFDRLYFTLAFFVWGANCLKRMAHLSWWDNAQNLAMLACLAIMVALNMLAPRFYRRYSPALRCGLLLYGYSMPILTSKKLMHIITPEPSQAAHMNWLVDTFSLWLSTRIAFLGWAVVGCRPPLYLALPLQLAGLQRIRGADFCNSPVLHHPVMQERTALAHFGMALASAGLGSHLLHTIVPNDPEQRCRALLLFYGIIFAAILPLLLLVPLRGTPAGEAQGGEGLGRVTRWLEVRVEGTLGLLMPSSPAAWQHRGGPVLVRHTRMALVLRWWGLLVSLWTACCLLEG